MDYNIFAIVGFLFAAYAVVGNDALQTLGTFINSNKRLHWTVLYLFAASILVVVFVYGYVTSGGDPAFDRLNRFGVENGGAVTGPAVEWYHILPPLTLLFLTRLGIPVSTTFMVLTIFASTANLQSMLIKSGLGYIVAFGVGGLTYAILAPTLERFFIKTKDQQYAAGWVVLQWMTTAYLWGVWLMQDFANIFIFLPLEYVPVDGGGYMATISPIYAYGGLAAIAVFLAVTFANAGGPVQRILKSKTSVTDIRSATIIDFMFGTILFVFKEMSDIPMSTTWVFLGLIAGREYAIATIDKVRPIAATSKIVLSDAGKAIIGLIISVVLALGLPWLASQVTFGF
ncbi:MAG: hypothetical protein AAGC95_12590 [Pseudomonadota bacterium]